MKNGKLEIKDIVLRPRQYQKEFGWVSYDVCAFIESTINGRKTQALITVFPHDKTLTAEDEVSLTQLKFIDDVCGLMGANGTIYKEPMDGFQPKQNYEHIVVNEENVTAVQSILNGVYTLEGPLHSRLTYDLDVIQVRTEKDQPVMAGIVVVTRTSTGRDAGRFVIETKVPTKALEGLRLQNPMKDILMQAAKLETNTQTKVAIRNLQEKMNQGRARLSPISTNFRLVGEQFVFSVKQTNVLVNAEEKEISIDLGDFKC